MSISIEALHEAIQIKEEINRLEARLEQLIGGGVTPVSDTEVAPAKRRRRKMNAAGRARIAAAQRARWAKVKGQ